MSMNREEEMYKLAKDTNILKIFAVIKFLLVLKSCTKSTDQVNISEDFVSWLKNRSTVQSKLFLRRLELFNYI